MLRRNEEARIYHYLAQTGTFAAPYRRRLRINGYSKLNTPTEVGKAYLRGRNHLQHTVTPHGWWGNMRWKSARQARERAALASVSPQSPDLRTGQERLPRSGMHFFVQMLEVFVVR